MLADDYAQQRLSTFNPGREQFKPVNHHLRGADKLDSDQGIKFFLAKSGRDSVEEKADDDQARDLLDEDVILEMHDGLLYAQTEYT